jgi:hypothetical protein
MLSFTFNAKERPVCNYGECSVCYQEIPDHRLLCEACENDQRAEQAQAGDAERVFKERQARATAVE